jgi:hypothetical protein
MAARDIVIARIVSIASLLVMSSCAATYRPMLVEPKGGMPADAFWRCLSLLQARYQRIVVADEAEFRLQTEWVAGPKPDKPCQQRASLFLQDGAVACVVEVRYLGFGIFSSTPQWTPARSDRWLEDELGEAVEQALSAR